LGLAFGFVAHIAERPALFVGSHKPEPAADVSFDNGVGGGGINPDFLAVVGAAESRFEVVGKYPDANFKCPFFGVVVHLGQTRVEVVSEEEKEKFKRRGAEIYAETAEKHFDTELKEILNAEEAEVFAGGEKIS